MRFRGGRVFVVAFALATTLVLHANDARAADGTRVAVAPVEGRGALSLRLGAELAEIGYDVVPLAVEDAADGETIGRSLAKSDSVAALVLEDHGDGLLACAIERENLRRTCREVAARNEHVDDALVATRAAELVRVLVPIEPVVTKSRGKKAESATTETTSAEANAYEEGPTPEDTVAEARLGPGVIVPNGAPAELSIGVGGDWIATHNLALGVDAMIPLTAGSIDRYEGSASVRATTIDCRVDARYAVGHWEVAAGTGIGLMWVQMSGTSPNTFQGNDDSLVDPFALLHGELSAFVTRALAVRVDLVGGYMLSKAAIRFQGAEIAEIGRPLASSTLSLAMAWQ